ncbi:MAG: DNA methylase N-4 [Lachnospiraceae bacterium]|nr:DNA methylase N-4 [Lachnospiraceae bacterium]
MTYEEFLKGKMDISQESGFIIDDEELNPNLKDHQKAIVKWAIRGGCRAIFASYGLGKTVIQQEILHLILKHEGGKALIICPLGVRQEFTRDAERILGYKPPTYVRNMEEIRHCDNDMMITNYERVRDGDINPEYFMVTTLDEASVLRDFGSKTYQTFLPKFKNVKYKFVATATPAPNKKKELIHYAGYLGICDTGSALTKYFKRDSTKANKLTLYPLREEEFWMWMSSWALFVSKPSDLDSTFSDEGYDLPELEVRWHELGTDMCSKMDKDGQLLLFEDAAAGLQEAARVKRESVGKRIEEMKRIIEESPEDHFLIWHDTDKERDAIKKALPEVEYITGTMDMDIREQKVIDFSDGKIKWFATKKSLSGSGCNFQHHCHRAIFLGIDYEANNFMQALHRIYRFLQDKKVIIDIIFTEEEKAIKEELLRKWKDHDAMVLKMTDIVKQYGLNDAKRYERLQRKMGVEKVVKVEGKLYTVVNDDCVQETKRMEENSVDMILTSIPFGNHYEYSLNYADMGHNKNDDDFFSQMDYLTPELLRVLRPGRVAAIHVKDRIEFGNATGTGFPTVEPFHDYATLHFMKHGFQYIGMIVILTDVVRENNQTYRLGWSEQCKDGTKMGVGCPEYVLLFRKLQSDKTKAYADVPVSKSKDEYTRAQWQIDAHAFWRDSGDRLVTKEELKEIPTNIMQKVYTKYSRSTVYNYHDHVELCEKMDKEDRLPATFMVCAPASWNLSEIWDDIVRMRVLNLNQTNAKKQNHVCPLQLGTIERLVNRFTNKGETVYDPFSGIGSTGYQAIRMGRKYYGCELSSDYFRDGVGYLQAAEDEIESPTLFDFLSEVTDAS